MARDNGYLLDVHDLRTEFVTDRGVITAVDGVSLRVAQGKTVALVGESGCGKSVTALSIMRLLPEPIGRITGGQILLADKCKPEPQASACANRRGRGFFRKNPLNDPLKTSSQAGAVDLLQLSEHALRSIRGNRIAMIFQEPLTALNPVFSVGAQIVEAIELHQPLRGKAARAKAVDLLRSVGIADPEQRVRAYPHELSGGMRQRVMIAMAVACEPSLLIADEPTTALDVTVQTQILDLLGALQDRTGMGILLITHDLGVVAQAADYVYVMYAGRIIEHAPAAGIFDEPLHPYTQALLQSMPSIGRKQSRLEVIPGAVPDPAHLPSGCRFHPRCRRSVERAGRGERATVPIEPAFGKGDMLRRCVESYPEEPSGRPELREVRPDHYAACWEVDEAGHRPVRSP